MRSRPPEKSGHAAIAAAPAVPAGRSTLVHLLSGGLAAGGVRAALLPLDTVKTRLQAGSAAGGRAALFAGGVRGMYRGVVPGLAGIVPAAALYMATFQGAKTAICGRLPRRMRSAGVALAAGVADFAACLVRVPCERLKQRLQIGLYGNVRDALVDVARRRELSVLYAGLNAQLARDIPYAAVEFVIYERLQGQNAGRGAEGDGRRRAQKSFSVGAVSGAAAAFLSNPLDVVKTRLMTQGGGTAVRYRGVVHALRTIAREEGPSAFCKGIAPRIAAKTLQSALFFAAYEGLRERFLRLLKVRETNKARLSP